LPAVKKIFLGGPDFGRPASRAAAVAGALSAGEQRDEVNLSVVAINPIMKIVQAAAAAAAASGF